MTQLAEMTADEEDEALSQLDTESANKWFRMRYGPRYWNNMNWKKRYSASYVYKMGKLMRSAKWASRAGAAAVEDVQKGLVMLSNRFNLVKRSIAKFSKVFLFSLIVISIVGHSFGDFRESESEGNDSFVDSVLKGVNLHANSFQRVECDSVSEPGAELFDVHVEVSFSSHPVTDFVLNLFFHTVKRDDSDSILDSFHDF